MSRSISTSRKRRLSSMTSRSPSEAVATAPFRHLCKTLSLTPSSRERRSLQLPVVNLLHGLTFVIFVVFSHPLILARVSCAGKLNHVSIAATCFALTLPTYTPYKATREAQASTRSSRAATSPKSSSRVYNHTCCPKIRAKFKINDADAVTHAKVAAAVATDGFHFQAPGLSPKDATSMAGRATALWLRLASGAAQA